jgi:serine/threonine protein kinase
MIAKKDLVARINSSKNKLPTKDYLLNALKNEVNTWKTLNHPNIVSFYDFSETASNIYVFLELCEDGYSIYSCSSLDKLVSERGRLPEPEAIQLFT